MNDPTPSRRGFMHSEHGHADVWPVKRLQHRRRTGMTACPWERWPHAVTIKSQGLNNERPLVYTYGCHEGQKVLHNSRAKHPAAVTKCDMERPRSATVMTLTSSGGDTLTRRQAEMVSAQTGSGVYTTSTQTRKFFFM